MRIIFGLAAVLALTACIQIVPDTPRPAVQQPAVVTRQLPVHFDFVVRRLEPVAEQICRDRAPNANCNFRIFIDDRPDLPPNAYQRLDETGRPEIGFTTALIARAHNDDELAFVMGHEAAHHIAGHLTKTRDTAVQGAILGGLLAVLAGASGQDVELAQNVGGTLGARTYSKDFELEADRLGTRIAYQAGYDPLAGSQFFARIPDPGDQFLGTHPPNGARMAAVRQAMSDLN